MNKSSLVAEVTGIHLARMSMLIDKGRDYANEDILSNFKRMSRLTEILGITPSSSSTDCALFLALLKLDRWCNLRRQKVSPTNESLKDTIQDLHNYIDLAYCCSFDDG